MEDGHIRLTLLFEIIYFLLLCPLPCGLQYLLWKEYMSHFIDFAFVMFTFFLWLYQVLAVACELLAAACGNSVSQLGIELGPLLWEHGATGPTGKSPHFTDFGLDHFSCFGQRNVNRCGLCHVWACEFILSCSSLPLEWAYSIWGLFLLPESLMRRAGLHVHKLEINLCCYQSLRFWDWLL